MVATLAVLAPAAASADAEVCVSDSLPADLAERIADAIALELELTRVECGGALEGEPSVRVRIDAPSPVSRLTIELAWDDRVSSTRTDRPADVMGPRAIAVVARSLLDELRTPPAIEPTSTTDSTTDPTTDSSSAAPDVAPEPVDAPPRASAPLLYLDVSALVAVLIGWGDATVSDLELDARMNALVIGGAVRVHHPSGHGGALAVRFFPSEIVSVLEIDARYSFFVGHHPRVDRVGVGAYFEAGLGVVRGWYQYSDETGARIGVIDRVGVGPTLAIDGFLMLGPVVLGVAFGWIGSVNPWGSRDLLDPTGHAGEITFGSDMEIVLRLGTRLPVPP